MTEQRAFVLVLGLVALTLGCVMIGGVLGSPELGGGIGVVVSGVIVILIAIFGSKWRD